MTSLLLILALAGGGYPIAGGNCAPQTLTDGGTGFVCGLTYIGPGAGSGGSGGGGVTYPLAEPASFSPDAGSLPVNAAIDSAGTVTSQGLQLHGDGSPSPGIVAGFDQRGGAYVDGQLCLSRDVSGNACGSVVEQNGILAMNQSTLGDDGGDSFLWQSIYPNGGGSLEVINAVYQITYDDGGYLYPDGGDAHLGFTVQTWETCTRAGTCGFAVPVSFTEAFGGPFIGSNGNIVAVSPNEVVVVPAPPGTQPFAVKLTEDASGLGDLSPGLKINIGEGGASYARFTSVSGFGNSAYQGVNVAINSSGTPVLDNSANDGLFEVFSFVVGASTWSLTDVPNGTSTRNEFLDVDYDGSLYTAATGSLQPGSGTSPPHCAAAHVRGTSVGVGATWTLLATGSKPTHFCTCSDTGTSAEHQYQWCSIAAADGATMTCTGGDADDCP